MEEMKKTLKKVINDSISYLDAVGCAYVVACPNGLVLTNYDERPDRTILTYPHAVVINHKYNQKGGRSWKDCGIEEELTGPDCKSVVFSTKHLDDEAKASLHSAICSRATKLFGQNTYRSIRSDTLDAIVLEKKDEDD